jgi:hypothetical protein
VRGKFLDQLLARARPTKQLEIVFEVTAAVRKRDNIADVASCLPMERAAPGIGKVRRLSEIGTSGQPQTKKIVPAWVKTADEGLRAF